MTYAFAAAAASFSVDSLVHLLIYLVVIGLIFWLLWWFIGFVGLPEPFNKVARVVIALVAVLILVGFLLSLTGTISLR